MQCKKCFSSCIKAGKRKTGIQNLNEMFKDMDLGIKELKLPDDKAFEAKVTYECKDYK